MFVHPLLYFPLDFLLDIDDLHFIDKFECQLLVPFPEIRLTQNLLLVRIIERNIGRNLVDQFLQSFHFQELRNRLFRHLTVFRSIIHEHVLQTALHRLAIQVFRYRHIRIVNHLDLSTQIRVVKFNRVKTPPRLPGHKHSYNMLRQFDDLLDRTDRADFIHILNSRIFGINRFLSGQKDLLVFRHRLLNRRDRTLSAHIKMHDHLRHDNHSSESDHRQALYLIVHSFSSYVNRTKTKSGYTWHNNSIAPAHGVSAPSLCTL